MIFRFLCNLLVTITVFSIMLLFILMFIAFVFAEKGESGLQGQVNTEAFHSQRTQRQGGDIVEYIQKK